MKKGRGRGRGKRRRPLESRVWPVLRRPTVKNQQRDDPLTPTLIAKQRRNPDKVEVRGGSLSKLERLSIFTSCNVAPSRFQWTTMKSRG